MKLYLKSDRTSCHRFVANQFRLFLHSAAYVLIHSLQANVLKHTQWSKVTMATIRLRLFKIGAKVQELKTRIKVELPSSFPLKITLSRSFQIFERLRDSWTVCLGDIDTISNNNTVSCETQRWNTLLSAIMTIKAAHLTFFMGNCDFFDEAKFLKS